MGEVDCCGDLWTFGEIYLLGEVCDRQGTFHKKNAKDPQISCSTVVKYSFLQYTNGASPRIWSK